MTTTPFSEFELEEALGDLGVEECEIRRAYSGRGMYGASCFGVVHSGSGASVGIAMAMAAIRATGEYDEGVFLEVQDICRCESRDNMGMQMITYFPGWELADD